MTDVKETLLEFPCEFPIKAFGKNSPDFEALVASIVDKHVPSAEQAAISSRSSNGDKYLAVTVTFTAQSQAQLDALYQELGDSERVLMLF